MSASALPHLSVECHTTLRISKVATLMRSHSLPACHLQCDVASKSENKR